MYLVCIECYYNGSMGSLRFFPLKSLMITCEPLVFISTRYMYMDDIFYSLTLQCACMHDKQSN